MKKTFDSIFVKRDYLKRHDCSARIVKDIKFLNYSFFVFLKLFFVRSVVELKQIVFSLKTKQIIDRKNQNIGSKRRRREKKKKVNVGFKLTASLHGQWNHRQKVMCYDEPIKMHIDDHVALLQPA